MDLMENILKAFKKKYGQDAEFQEGETQVFLLKDCTVVVSLTEGELQTNIIGDKPIKVNCKSGLFS